MNEPERLRRENGLLYDCFAIEDDSYMKARHLLLKINACPTSDAAREYLEDMLGSFPKSSQITPPFYCDLGPQIHFGENVHMNMDCLLLDEARIQFGDRVLIGPRCTFYTPVHPFDPDIRATGLEKARPIVIGDDVWLGGSCVINGGVTIGKGSIIGSGSVVTRDIEPDVIAAGNPCKVIRKISDEEKAAWRKEYQEYLDYKKGNR